MDKLKLHTPDFVEANAAKLAELFPNCVSESKAADGSIKRAIDFDLLRQELSEDLVEGPQERYRLDWPGKREALALANAPIRKTLRPCKEESVDFETTQNLYIEGDNLDALKLLQETYLGKVKMIYIDPPYNTGNDFIYDDNFSMSREEYEESSGEKDEEGNAMFDEEKWRQNSNASGRFHSEWLSMIYPRLKSARNLLSDDGAIFISIDDCEAANLRRLCDEVFGAENYVATFVWQKRYSRENRGSIGDAHEYILVFAKSIVRFSDQSGRIPLTEEQARVYRNPNNDPKGRWRGIPMTAQGFRPNQMYEITTPSGNVITPPEGRCWSTVESEYLKLKERGRIYFGKENDSQPQIIRYLSEVEGVVPWTWLPHEDGGHTDESKKEIYGVFGKGFPFDTPKPTKLLRHLIRVVSRETDFTVLDFFSGSATTAHALMEVNAEDGGMRRHIQVQVPEPCEVNSEALGRNFASVAAIGKERIRRAGAKIKDEIRRMKDEGKADDLFDEGAPRKSKTSSFNIHPSYLKNPKGLDTGFRVLKIDSSNMADVYYQPDQLTQDALALQVDNVKPDRSPEDLLFQVLLDWGVDLASPISKEIVKAKKDEGGRMKDEFEVFWVGENDFVACFDTGVTEELVKQLAKREPLRAVFRDAGYASDSTKINIEQIFKALSPHTELKTI